MSVTRARSLRRMMSPPEARLWNALRMEPLGAFHFRRQVPIGPYYADFASHRARLVIEVDGSSHATARAMVHDVRRDDFMHRQRYRVLRFSASSIFREIDGVFFAICAALDLPQ